MNHERAWELLPDLVTSPDQAPTALRAHLRGCHACQRRLFLLQRVDRVLREGRPAARCEQRRPRGGLARVVMLVAALAAAALFTVQLTGTPNPAPAMAIRAASGVPVAQARVRDVGSGQIIQLDPGSSALATTTNYVLWGRSGQDRVRLGMFMSNSNGTCRARFTMSTQRTWQAFWITPASRRNTIVAQT